MSKSQGQNKGNKNSSLIKRWNADTDEIRVVKKPTGVKNKSKKR